MFSSSSILCTCILEKIASKNSSYFYPGALGAMSMLEKTDLLFSCLTSLNVFVFSFIISIFSYLFIYSFIYLFYNYLSFGFFSSIKCM